MTTMAETTGEDGSWLKKRSSVFSTTSSPTNNIKSVGKPADKELARLKTMGAVSSVWTNKFVQEDSSNSTTGGRQHYFFFLSCSRKKTSIFFFLLTFFSLDPTKSFFSSSLYLLNRYSTKFCFTTKRTKITRKDE